MPTKVLPIPSKRDSALKRKALVINLVFALCVAGLIFIAHQPRNHSDSQQPLIKGMPLPISGVWNGFNRQVNAIECSNLSVTTAHLRLSVRDFREKILGERLIELGPYKTSRSILNDYSIGDSYGTYQVDAASAKGKAIAVSCSTLFYREALPDSNRHVEFAYSIPPEEPLRGVSAGIYNSLSSDLNDEYQTHNSLSVYNPGTKRFNASVEVYDKAGIVSEDKSFRIRSLTPGDRIDYALGEEQGQSAGIYRIIPRDLHQPYGAFLSRFHKAKEDVHSFGYTLPALGGYCDTGPLSVVTLRPATAYIELGNISSKNLEVVLEWYSKDNSLLHRDSRELAPYSPRQIALDSISKDAQASHFRAYAKHCRGSDPPLLAQSLFFGKSTHKAPAAPWAYASPSRGVSVYPRSKHMVPLNTFFGAENWLRLLSLYQTPTAVHIDLIAADGRKLSSNLSGLSLKGYLELPLHKQVGPDFLGYAVASVHDSDKDTTAEMLRVIPNRHSESETKEVDFIISTPASSITEASLPRCEDLDGGNSPETPSFVRLMDNKGYTLSLHEDVCQSASVLEEQICSPKPSSVSTECCCQQGRCYDSAGPLRAELGSSALCGKEAKSAVESTNEDSIKLVIKLDGVSDVPPECSITIRGPSHPHPFLGQTPVFPGLPATYQGEKEIHVSLSKTAQLETSKEAATLEISSSGCCLPKGAGSIELDISPNASASNIPAVCAPAP